MVCWELTPPNILFFKKRKTMAHDTFWRIRWIFRDATDSIIINGVFKDLNEMITKSIAASDFINKNVIDDNIIIATKECSHCGSEISRYGLDTYCYNYKNIIQFKQIK